MLKLGNNLFLSAKILNALVALVAIALLIWNGVSSELCYHYQKCFELTCSRYISANLALKNIAVISLACSSHHALFFRLFNSFS